MGRVHVSPSTKVGSACEITQVVVNGLTWELNSGPL